MIRIKAFILMMILLAIPMAVFAQEAQQDQQPDAVLMGRLSELTGTGIALSAGDAEGSIEDAVLNTRDGSITHWVVSVGGVQTPAETTEAAEPGLQQDIVEGESYLIPADRVTFGPDFEVATLDLSAEELEGQQALVDGMLPAAIEGVESDAPLILGTRLRDFSVVGIGGEDLAGVEDIMLDLQRMEVAYLAIESGGFLGIGENLYAVPMGAVMDVNVEEEQVQMRLNEERLEAMESFAADEWPDAEAEYGWADYEWAGEWEMETE